MSAVSDANRVLDQALGGEDGVSPIRFGERRIARDYRRAQPWMQASPYRVTWREHANDVLQILAGIAVLLLLAAGGWLWLSIGVAVQVPR